MKAKRVIVVVEDVSNGYPRDSKELRIRVETDIDSYQYRTILPENDFLSLFDRMIREASAEICSAVLLKENDVKKEWVKVERTN